MSLHGQQSSFQLQPRVSAVCAQYHGVLLQCCSELIAVWRGRADGGNLSKPSRNPPPGASMSSPGAGTGRRGVRWYVQRQDNKPA